MQLPPRLTLQLSLLLGLTALLAAAPPSVYEGVPPEMLHPTMANRTGTILFTGRDPSWQPGSRHPSRPNVIAGNARGHWDPAPGYRWASPGSPEMKVVWVPGLPHPANAHCIASKEEGRWHPEEGWHWADATRPIAPDVLPDKIAGIGLLMAQETTSHTITVLDAVPGSPAARAGLKPGTVIKSVNGVSVAGKSLPDVSTWIRGPAGTTVKLEVLAPGAQEPFTIEMTRDEVDTRSLAVSSSRNYGDKHSSTAYRSDPITIPLPLFTAQKDSEDGGEFTYSETSGFRSNPASTFKFEEGAGFKPISPLWLRVFSRGPVLSPWHPDFRGQPLSTPPDWF